jgi:hypothetical protein
VGTTITWPALFGHQRGETNDSVAGVRSTTFSGPAYSLPTPAA